MRIDIHHHYSGFESVEALLTETNRLLAQLTEQGTTIMADLSRLTQEVTENNDAIQSAISLLGNLSQMIRDLEPTAEAITALADQLDSQSNALAGAVVANTPAAPGE